jgi:hypothetical protein
MIPKKKKRMPDTVRTLLRRNDVYSRRNRYVPLELAKNE